ncbi:hypothetical protein, partial [Teichococcus wenyumeiae]|uniref:hypothetical protein n=1 Tax=Teichococcus wenyumeiae TaxID=2478470 RepID=UPI0038D168EC
RADHEQKQDPRPDDICVDHPPPNDRRRPNPFLGPWRLGLDPAEESGVRDLDAAVLKHKFEIAVADREHQVPSDRPEDHLDGELSPLEGLIRPH